MYDVLSNKIMLNRILNSYQILNVVNVGIFFEFPNHSSIVILSIYIQKIELIEKKIVL